MRQFVPYEKRSKKAKKAADAKRRGSWGALSPVTRLKPSKKLYTRKKTDWRSEQLHESVFCLGNRAGNNERCNVSHRRTGGLPVCPMTQ